MRNTCSEVGCNREAYGRGLCSAHYQRARYHETLPDVLPEKVCEQCGNIYRDRKWNSRYCSRACNELARYERTRRPERLTSVCRECGSTLEGLRTDALFCSPSCSNNWRSKQAATRRLDAKAKRPPCRGCGASVPASRKGNALYCSDECKIRSRRHEKYGLTRDELDSLLAQHGVCAICQTDEWGRKGPQVDHDHATGRVRGILCVRCNTMLGHALDDLDCLKGAIAYLERRP